jgi:hypothetical protein|tara:strand:+ start:174 stop:584 length:411 start_codon:yes stop_codon:yes gene_type:complete
MNSTDLGYWTLPKPDVEVKEWKRIPRVARTVPFGYKEDPNDKDFLLPIKEELDALEQAKSHLQQYSYREVANWLSKEAGRYISHMGLKKRIQVERRRKKSATIKRELTRRLEKAIKEIEKIETERTGSYTSNGATA